MKGRWIILAVTLSVLAAILFGCDYARMKETEVVRTYETDLPEMPDKTIPVKGGLYAYRVRDPEKIRNPIPYDPESVSRGEKNYGHYCIMCHGPKADGNGTVGQSFSPLPTNLRSPYVQNQSDGRLFYVITFGYKRHPDLGFMITEVDRWSIVNYIRSLPNKS